MHSMLYTPIKNTWHSINYIRHCHNYQGQWAEAGNYFYYLNERHSTNRAALGE